MDRERILIRDATGRRTLASCRLCKPREAAGSAGFRAEELFDFRPIDLVRDRLVEVTHLDIEPGAPARALKRLLWDALARYLIDGGHDYLVATACIDASDGGGEASALFRWASERAASPDDLRVLPWRALPLESACGIVGPSAPALVHAYIEEGAWICGEPAWQPERARAHLPFLLPLARMRSRAARQFLASAA